MIPFVVAIDPAIETLSACATKEPATAPIAASMPLAISICDKRCVKREEEDGGTIINATTNIAPAHSKAPTIVMHVSAMSP